jgi:catechol 2,3-dioxygenase-like lactoylglutathione lyase family enzyme
MDTEGKLTFNHAMIYVKDVDRGLRFYRDLLGFKLMITQFRTTLEGDGESLSSQFLRFVSSLPLLRLCLLAAKSARWNRRLRFLTYRCNKLRVDAEGHLNAPVG